MVFSSMTFLCIFLPVIFGLHLLARKIQTKNMLLLLASVLFYAYGEPVYVLLLFGSVLINYVCALLIAGKASGKKFFLVVAVILNLGMLTVFKYTGFLVETFHSITGVEGFVPQIEMPIGISFFTFQAMSYVIDVYRGTAAPQKSFLKVLLYISFFPQLIAGPIVKYHDIAKEIDERKQTLDETVLGIRRFVAGLCKKVLISNTMGLAADTLFGCTGGVNAFGAWIGAISYLFQIYFDFSGYSDMAIGLGQIFGFHFKENFNYPYISSSMKEFWRRWHMSLSGWFRDYLYIPLGGNKKGKGRTIFNKWVVFFCTGFWHGASFNFIFWGLYHGFFLMLEELVPAIQRKGGKLKSVLQHVYTLLIVCIGFVFFRAETMGQGVYWVRQMFAGFGCSSVEMSVAVQTLTPLYLVSLVAAMITACPVVSRFKNRSWYDGVAGVMSIAGLLACILYLAAGTYNPFIYFRF